jgi:hypothetical protein
VKLKFGGVDSLHSSCLYTDAIRQKGNKTGNVKHLGQKKKYPGSGSKKEKKLNTASN